MPFKKGKSGNPKGLPKGTKHRSTLDKELLREELRKIVSANMRPMTEAQVDNATGIRHFMLRDSATGKFERITDEKQIDSALKNGELAEGSHYWIYTKDPSVKPSPT